MEIVLHSYELICLTFWKPLNSFQSTSSYRKGEGTTENRTGGAIEQPRKTGSACFFKVAYTSVQSLRLGDSTLVVGVGYHSEVTLSPLLIPLPCAKSHFDATAQMIAVKKGSPRVTLHRPTKSVSPPRELSLLVSSHLGPRPVNL